MAGAGLTNLCCTGLTNFEFPKADQIIATPASPAP
jgi:hypothetical protein